jgi:hypothetical protein
VRTFTFITTTWWFTIAASGVALFFGDETIFIATASSVVELTATTFVLVEMEVDDVVVAFTAIVGETANVGSILKSERVEQEKSTETTKALQLVIQCRLVVDVCESPLSDLLCDLHHRFGMHFHKNVCRQSYFCCRSTR